MNEDFVSFDLAKKLKEKGFKNNCIGYYDYAGEFHYGYASNISNREIYFCHNKYDNIWHRDLVDAPTISQVLKWLREEKNMHVVCPFYKDEGFYYYVQRLGNAARIVSSFGDSDDCFNTYGLAALAGIEYVLDNLI